MFFFNIGKSTIFWQSQMGCMNINIPLRNMPSIFIPYCYMRFNFRTLSNPLFNVRVYHIIEEKMTSGNYCGR